MGLLDKTGLKKLKEGLAKTRNNIIGKISQLVGGYGKIDENFLTELEEILITSDVGAETSMMIIDKLKERIKKENVSGTDEIISLLKQILEDMLVSADEADPLETYAKPHVIMVVGVNGVGKTTTVGKLAYNFRKKGKTVLIGATDTFRAGANEQIEIWADRAGVDIVKQQKGSDPGAVAFDTLKSAIARNIDVVIIDTAGRLHTKTNLMEELKKVKRVMSKLIPEAPHEVLLVLDATTGQNAIQQAREFSKALGLTGLVITKLDGTAKGGVVFGIMRELKVPIKFVGVGEKIDDLQPFDKKAFINTIFEK